MVGAKGVTDRPPSEACVGAPWFEGLWADAGAPWNAARLRARAKIIEAESVRCDGARSGAASPTATPSKETYPAHGGRLRNP